jgi:fructose-specific phosphotransferase system IIC component
MREQRLRIANALSIAGLLFLVPGMLGALFVITDLLFGVVVASIVAGVLVVVLLGLWFAIPLAYRNQHDG